MDADSGFDDEILIRPGEFLFQFETFNQWVNKARGWFKNHGVSGSDCICVDTAGRLCKSGREFMRANEEQTFPIRVFRQVK